MARDEGGAGGSSMEISKPKLEKGSLAERLHLVHRRLGHPSAETMVRMLQMGGAGAEVIEQARTLQCPVCQMRKAPPRPLPTRPGSRPVAFNVEMHMDLKYQKDFHGSTFVALSMVDAATCYHAAKLLRTRDPQHVARKLVAGWIATYGAPVTIVSDQGGEFETEVIAVLESYGIASKISGSYAPWQNGLVERHNGLLGTAWQAAIEGEQVVGRHGMKIALAVALQAKNATVSRRGHSAHQLVFGRQAYFPELLDEEIWQSASAGFALSIEGEVARQTEMRAAAKIALLRGDIHEKLRAALRRAPGGEVRQFYPGEMIFFWSPVDPKRVRYKKQAGAWRGPAVVLVPDGAQKYFISWRGRCLLVAGANLKPASLEAADDNELRLREAEVHAERGFVDLSDDLPPASFVPESGGQLRVPRRRNGLGRRMTEARHMMKNLKSVKRMLKLPLNRPRARRRPLRPPGVSRREAERLPESAPERSGDQLPEGLHVPPVEHPEFQEDDVDLRDYEPSPEYVPVSPMPDSTVSREQADEERARRRADLLDDLPKQFRKRPPEESLEDQAAKRFKEAEGGNYVLAALCEEQLSGKEMAANEWLPRPEVRRLSKLLGVPLSSARLHRRPRKRLQPPGGLARKAGKARMTVMFGEDISSVMVAKESPDEVRQHPRRRVPHLWRGVSFFMKSGVKKGPPRFKTGSPHEPVYVVKEGVVYETKPVPFEVFAAADQAVERDVLVKEALLLKLKASGKELDPRFFDEKEKKAFDEADALEWSAWERNGVVKRLSQAEARRVPQHRIFRVPARIVRVSKGDPKNWKPKSRIVLPGHLDPDPAGSIRTDSPTTQEAAVRLAMCLCVSKGWLCYLFDVTTAFLSGKEVGRELYVRPPRDLKCTAADELWLILRSAYGLAEAPRLWYEKAKESLVECGFEEVAFAPCTFVLRIQTAKSYEVRAVLCLHVDDGLLAACQRHMDQIKDAINARFQIKCWNLVGETPLDFLGLKISIVRGLFVSDMTAYVQSINVPELAEVPKQELLRGEHLKAYRRLVAQLRWPAHHVLPEFLFDVSRLAQRVACATGQDLLDGVELLGRFWKAASEGQAKLFIPPVGEKPVLVSYFDASLGKVASSTAQRGEVHFLANREVITKPQAAAILEFHSNKIARVMKSSMAAECCSMSGTADKLMYLLKLVDAMWYGQLEVAKEWRDLLLTQGHLVTDAKSLYDHLHGSSLLASERQTALDILSVKQLVQGGQLSLHWVPTWRQFADSLMKSMQEELFRKFREKPQLNIKETREDQAEERRRAGLRRAQRERRKARMAM